MVIIFVNTWGRNKVDDDMKCLKIFIVFVSWILIAVGKYVETLGGKTIVEYEIYGKGVVKSFNSLVIIFVRTWGRNKVDDDMKWLKIFIGFVEMLVEYLDFINSMNLELSNVFLFLIFTVENFENISLFFGLIIETVGSIWFF